MIEYNSMFEKKIDRLKSTLSGRLKLLNMFKQLVDKNYSPVTMENIKIDIESEHEVTDFIIRNNEHIDSCLIKCVEDWFSRNSPEWKRRRIQQYFK